MVLPCESDIDDVEEFNTGNSAGPTERSSRRAPNERVEESMDVLSRTEDEIESLEMERLARRQTFGVPLLLQHLGRRVLAFILLLATGRA